MRIRRDEPFPGRAALRWALPVVALTIVGPSRLTAAEPNGTANPHWKPEGCGQCHVTTGEVVRPIAPAEIDAICLKCHDGRIAKREMHPIGRAFGAAGIVKPERWPAPDGQLSCATCHDIRRACDHDRSRPARNSEFLRDYDADNPSAFCARCHVETEAHARFNPHRMLNRSGERVAQTCQFCHAIGIESRGLSARTGDPLLMTPEPALCLSCHDRHLDYFEPGHVGARISSASKAAMLAVERMRTIRPVMGEGDGALFRLPLGPADTVICSTCHNPHQEGLFPPHTVLSAGAFQPDASRDTIPLRVPAKDLCHACHSQ